MNDFPKWIYWPDGSSEIIDGPAELLELEDGWSEVPVAPAEPAPKRKRK